MPTSPPEASPPDDQVAAIELASRRLVQLLIRASESAPLNVSGAQMSAIRIIERAGPLNLTQLAEELGTIPSWASRLCDRLEADGYIERKQKIPGQREVAISLRPAGRRLLDEVTRRRRDSLAEVLMQMSAADRRQLQRGLEAFGRTAEGGRPQVESA